MARMSNLQCSRLQRVESQVPLSIRPLLRAFLLGYLTSTVPRLLGLLLTHFSGLRKAHRNVGQTRLISSLIRTVRGGFHWRRFPAFCALLVGGSTFFEFLSAWLISSFTVTASLQARTRAVKWCSGFTAAWLSIKLLQSHDSEAFIERAQPNTFSEDGLRIKDIRFAGRTLDLTLFSLTRAVDVAVGSLWARRKEKKLLSNSWSKLDILISKLIDPAVFAGSCAVIMWAWVYLPERLPRAYSQWITSASGIDQRLLIALRRASWGEFLYGKETGQAPLLTPMCREYGWPEVWGDPSITVPIPCQMVHMGTGTNCESHALSRLKRGFLFAMSIYLPVNLALRSRRPSKENFKVAIKSALQSSAFLGSFIGLFYYGVCLARSRIGPKLLGTSIRARQHIDSGLCIASGCMLCGWSLLLEEASRRKDLALFVAPRALATILPRRYELGYQTRENVAFAASVATVFLAMHEDPTKVRGVFGKVLKKVLVN